MKHALLSVAASASLLIFGVSAGFAQDDHWYQERDSYFHEQAWKAHLFDRVRTDLDRVQANTFPLSKDEYRIARTKEQLNELQSKMTEGRYDQPELDDVIAGLQRVVASNKLSPRDRDVLNDDMNRLRDYREHHENWGR